MLTDSLGDLCHTKASLRLNLLSSSTKLIPATPNKPLVQPATAEELLKPEQNAEQQSLSSFEEDEGNCGDQPRKGIPSSCTGSMDSLSSSSGSERQVSFTTFGKPTIAPTNTSPSGHRGAGDHTDSLLPRVGGNGSTGMIFIENVQLADDDDVSPPTTPPALRSSSRLDTISLPFDTSSISLTTVESSGKPQNDSTDEDSGIESIMRIKSTTPPLPPTTS